MRYLNEKFFGESIAEDPNEHFRVLVSPDVAKAMLTQNSNNRTIRPRQVAAYARDMENGNWNEDAPNAIVFSQEGALIDGQHRLNAVISSKKTIAMNVTILAKDAQLGYIDRNIRRTVKDSLKMFYGVNPGQTLISGLKLWAVYELTDFQPGAFVQNNFVITDAQHQKVYLDCPEQWELVNKIVKNGSHRPIAYRKAAIVAAMAAYKCGVKEEDLTDFFVIVNSGVPVKGRDTDSSAAFVARNYLQAATKANAYRHKAAEVDGKLEEYIYMFVKGTQRKRQIADATWRYTKMYGDSIRNKTKAQEQKL